MTCTYKKGFSRAGTGVYLTCTCAFAMFYVATLYFFLLLGLYVEDHRSAWQVRFVCDGLFP
jgi:hypothetical protein